MLLKSLLSLLLFATWLGLSAQPGAQKRLLVRQAGGEIQIDGDLSEADWKAADVAKDFWQNFPSDTLAARARTEVKITYDKRFLYVGAVCYNPPQKKKYVIQSLRRDFDGSGLDEFGINLDPFNDQTNGFSFATNPYSVQREALITNGGGGFRDSENISWDNKWFVKTIRHPNHWTVEMAIPFKTLRFKEGLAEWNLNFYRQDNTDNERSVWVPIPQQFRTNSLAFVGKLVWDQPLQKSGTNVALIPYITGGVTRDFEDDQQTGNHWLRNLGGDAKIGVTSSLNLDLTVNPDFSQVEVDQQVTNLDRFEIFFPERRQFFLENSDLFSAFGNRSIRPFFSRRIGVAIDTSTGQNIQNPLYFGARLSGKVNRDWRIGLMSVQAAPDSAIGLNSVNYSVAAVQRRVFQRSNIAALLINKQSFNQNGDGQGDPIEFNRLAGLEYNLATKSDKWTGKVFYHRSFGPDSNQAAFAHGGQLTFRNRYLWATWNHEWVGNGFDAEVGFVRRTNYKRIAPEIWISMYPNSKWINRHGPNIEGDLYWNETDGVLDRIFSAGYRISTQSNGFYLARYNYSFIQLFDDFDPSRSEGLELPTGSTFVNHYLSGFLRTNGGAPVSTNLRFQAGQYFNGQRYSIGGELNFRFQPYILLGLNFSLNRVALPEPYNSASPVLFGPRLDVTFSNQLFFTLLTQYNSQFDNLNLNARLQWRFRPVSDLFIVYTDNMNTETWGPKNRGLVVKLTYWI